MTKWRKSSYSGGVNDEACVELARLGSIIGVRDSKEPDGSRMGLRSADFARLLTRIRHGELDLHRGVS
ncbi:DUF397 domain-containing protein [Actinomadura chokoriensis]|uniref:DUF397 domain-containing protein n=1 Tax=Actinomadura chokoriensis TaxID=454156 RepID=A0ABV4QRE2_9ACTN